MISNHPNRHTPPQRRENIRHDVLLPRFAPAAPAVEVPRVAGRGGDDRADRVGDRRDLLARVAAALFLAMGYLAWEALTR